MEGIFSDKFWKRLIDEFDSLKCEEQKPRPVAILMHLMIEIAINNFLDSEFRYKKLLNKDFEVKVKFLLKEEAIGEDTYRDLLTVNNIRCEYAHIRNLENLDPEEDKINTLLDSIQPRYPESKRKKPYRSLSHKIFDVCMGLMLDKLQEDFSEFLDVKKLVKENREKQAP